jgi:hypothetical protein
MLFHKLSSFATGPPTFCRRMFLTSIPRPPTRPTTYRTSQHATLDPPGVFFFCSPIVLNPQHNWHIDQNCVIMVLGRAGLRLEAQKFGIYLLIPIVASIAYNEPAVQRWSADYFQFMKYPSNPKTNLKEEFEQLQKEREQQKIQAEKNKESRKVYMEQLKQLNAVRDAMDKEENQPAVNRGWFSWLRGRRSNQSSSSDS